jgi:hypothetical protein
MYFHSVHEQIVAIAEAVRDQPLVLSCLRDGELSQGSEHNCLECDGYRFVRYGSSDVAVVKLVDLGSPKVLLRSQFFGDDYWGSATDLKEAAIAFAKHETCERSSSGP